MKTLKHILMVMAVLGVVACEPEMNDSGQVVIQDRYDVDLVWFKYDVESNEICVNHKQLLELGYTCRDTVGYMDTTRVFIMCDRTADGWFGNVTTTHGTPEYYAELKRLKLDIYGAPGEGDVAHAVVAAGETVEKLRRDAGLSRIDIGDRIWLRNYPRNDAEDVVLRPRLQFEIGDESEPNATATYVGACE